MKQRGSEVTVTLIRTYLKSISNLIVQILDLGPAQAQKLKARTQPKDGRAQAWLISTPWDRPCMLLQYNFSFNTTNGRLGAHLPSLTEHPTNLINNASIVAIESLFWVSL